MDEKSLVAGPEDASGCFRDFPAPERPRPPECCGFPESPVTAVIDIGSGSARAVVMRVNKSGGVEMLAQQKMNLDLMSHIGGGGELESESVERALDAVEDFVQVCRGYGVATIHAVGTAALRESRNAAEIAGAAFRRFGVSIRVISGFEEAAYCFAGAVHGLPVTGGLMADLGGGSMEVVGFARRSLETMRSIPLGSLRIANQFRLDDRPAAEDLDAARRYARECLASAQLPALGKSGALVGSGGSMRLLSKLDRRRLTYPALRMHGYCIDARRLAGLTAWLAGMTREERRLIPGMNPERTHSIVGGAVVAQALLELSGARRVMVSGQGLREGLARLPGPLPEDKTISLPPPSAVRKDGLEDLTRRFAPRFRERGPRRAELARRLMDAAWRGRHHRLASSLQCAALVLDIGSAIDFYNRFNRAATVVARSDLPGFSHRELAQIATILLAAERGRIPRAYRRAPLLTDGDKRRIGQAAAVLLVADELERRLPPDCPAAAVAIHRDDAALSALTPAWARTSAQGLGERWEAEFDYPIHIGRGEG